MVSSFFSVEDNLRDVRALYSADTIRVYQAFRPDIADLAVKNQVFVPPFKMERMTWIKTSFLWMMHRSAWATKRGQERVLAIDITRSGFDWALANACLSHYDAQLYESIDNWQLSKLMCPVLIQFDPDRGPHLQKLGTRAIQVGLKGEAIQKYVFEWIKVIMDITDCVHQLHVSVQRNNPNNYLPQLPKETCYPVPVEACKALGINPVFR